MNDYISVRIKDKIHSRISSHGNKLKSLLKTRHESFTKQDQEINYKLISFTIRNLKVWKEIQNRNQYYENKIQQLK